MKLRRSLRWLVSCFAAALAGCGGDPANDPGAGAKLPSLLSAKSLSAHYVELAFDRAVDPALGDPASYSIRDAESLAPLTVRSATVSADGLSVVLTTDGQEEASYTLTLAQSAPVAPQGGGSAVAANFPGTSTLEFTLGYAVALTNTTVLLVFSESVTAASAPVLSNYGIHDPDLLISGAARGTGSNTHTVTLSTSPQTDVLYSIKVVNLSNSHTLVDPERNTATFFGIDPVDTAAPRLIQAEPVSADQILLSFSEPLENFASDVASYSVNNGLTVLGASPNEWDTQVLLNVLPMTPDTQYTVSVQRVEDRAGNVIDPAFQTASFIYTDLDAGDQVVLPRVTGAISTGNRSVVVTFSKPMSDSVLNPSSYYIIQQNQQPEAGYLGVIDAEFWGDTRTSVMLTTLSQSELTYFLRVVNVEDMQGNQLAPPELLVDPATAVFPGTPASCLFTCEPGSGRPGGLTGQGVCLVDDDCDDDPPCVRDEADCAGKCEESCEAQDSDGDGLTDAEEQRGWQVLVELATRRGEHDEREITRRDVTSNPLSPDTDSDGLDDALEKQIGTDPRDKDSDDDLLLDEREYNLHYSNAVDQDSDDDEIDDFLEVALFSTSPIMTDTDGDQMIDAVELYERSRDPLIADLPIPQITVDEIALELEVKSSYTDEEGTVQSTSETTSSTFTDSRTSSLGTSSTNSTESENTFGQKIGAEGGNAGWKVSAEVNFGQSQSQGYSTTVDSESSQTSQQEYQESITKGLEFSESRSVTRTIESAIVQATVNIANKSDIAFSITNVELTLLQQDRVTGLTFRPIATLRPTAASDPTGQPVYNIGPLEPGRGPIIFENNSIFPNRVDALMREPTGLVVKVVNFDVLDEFQRNLVFTTQEVMDRTVAISIDFGDGRVELYRIATANDFDENGLPKGITMERALEIAGLAHDAVDSADPNTYATIVDTRPLDGGGTADVQALVRMRDVANTPDGKKFWTAVSSNTDLDPNSDFRRIRLFAHDVLLIMFTSDEDNDGLFLREEYLYGSDDDDEDSDDDTLGDFFEVRTGWTVAKVPGLPYRTFPSPARPDSDLDALQDPEEMTAGTDPNRADTDEDGRSDASELLDTYTIGLFDGDNDVTNLQTLTVMPYSDWAIVAGEDGACDTPIFTLMGDDGAAFSSIAGNQPWKSCVHGGADGMINTTPGGDDQIVAAPRIDPGPDGICDTVTPAGDDFFETLVVLGPIGFVCINAGKNRAIDTVPEDDDFVRVAHKGVFGTDPVKHDTDSDGINDGREVILGINPNSKDAGKVVDTDRDGLFDDEEDFGWLLAGTSTRVRPDKNLADSDRDGIPDVIERAIQSDPNNSNSDGDSILDYLEFDEANPLVSRYEGGSLVAAAMFDAVSLSDAFTRCGDAANCAYVAPHSSLITSTHPAKSDTDGDTRSDDAELNVACTFTVSGVETAVFSHPLFAESELSEGEPTDNRHDGLECVANGTNPVDPDTDDDLRNDGAEFTAGRNPLVKDYNLRVTLASVVVVGDCDDDTCKGLELEGSIKLRKPDTTEVTLHTEDCKTEECCCGCIGQECCDDSKCDNQDFLTGTDPSTQFVFQEDQTFSVSASLRDKDTFDCTDTGYQSVGSINDSVDFAVTPVNFTKDVGTSDSCKVRLTFQTARLD